MKILKQNYKVTFKTRILKQHFRPKFQMNTLREVLFDSFIKMNTDTLWKEK